ncbi:regulatory protein, gntR family [Rubritalea squalenifaciens DSM 18772]|uniref:Regulatory protein, gntR family n=1 Tax=Rubritalea squalenifaciens DSM 18772 TaxID=1123071 RepID=A0A1M6QGG7_9BACT|nr:substrate-binding domain-containing protein [Rubritalea squalenifaciens]SHK19163.1 regulatory protein, gntR family [Rubritalea squalenifaciens DSM 18772]
MKEKLDRSHLPERLADQITNLILAGEWTEELPGTRILAERFGVSRGTCVTAIGILERRGVLMPTEPRKTRRINSCEVIDRGEVPKTLLALHDAVSPVQPDKATAFMEAMGIWELSCGPAHQVAVDFSRSQIPGRTLKKLINKYAADAILIRNAPKAWIGAAVSLLPTYALGGSLPDSARVSHSAYEIDQQLEKVIRLLMSMGHRSIMVPCRDELNYTRAASQRVLTKNLGLSSAEVNTLCPTYSENVPGVWPDFWRRELGRVQPTAVILTDGGHLASLYTYCLSCGIRIPQQLSICLISHESILEWLHPQPAMMRFPHHKAVAHFRKWIEGGLAPLGSKFLELDLMSGASLASARNGVLQVSGLV